MNIALYALAATVVSAAVGGACRAQPEAPNWERGGLVTIENTERLDGVPSVWDLLGYAPGEHFTRHADMVRAIETVAEASPRVRFSTYGTTHQRRPLVQLTISSPENLANLDQILAANRELADPSTSDSRAREIMQNNPAVVWFSFGVHGNEASCPEAALRVIDTMASGIDPAIDGILDNVVLALDPSLNPDGHERYVSWYQNVLGSEGNAHPAASEHSEPWPGGRTNHYYFDLNRDWLWVVQPESRQRLARYTEFMPQLHIDFHEQGYTNPYFLGAGDEPYNTNIPRRTRDWIELYGEANAEAFDNEGRLYSTKERFDYLYPGYGKVLPVYHGAVGMLLEQAGHSRAGLGIEVDEHYTLTLEERSRNHWLIAMSNLQATARHREGQLARFREFFTTAVEEGRAEPWACVVSASTPQGLLAKVWDLCETHGIEVRVTDRELPIDGMTPVLGQAPEDGATLPAGSWVIATDQPVGRLVRAVFEPAPEITDRDTYDVTSWSLPATFGLDAYYTTEALSDTTVLDEWTPEAGQVTGPDSPVAYIVDSDSHDYPRALAAASRHDLTARLASDDFTVEGRTFRRGSLVAHTLRNRHADLDAFAAEIAATGMDVHRSGRGITEDGPVLAADSNSTFEHADIVLARGDSLSSLSFGQHWHMLDVAWDLPHTVVNFSSLRSADLDERSTLVLASGSAPASSQETINDFVRSGGVLVASGSAASWAHRSLLEISSESDDEEEEREDLKELTYEERRERSVDDRVPGALLRIDIDTSHPLSAGVPAHLAVIKSGTRTLDVRDSAYVIARYAPAESLKVGGSISQRNIDRLAGKPFMTAHRHGRGWVIAIADDVTFRGFEHGPMRLLLNAILMGPAL